MAGEETRFKPGNKGGPPLGNQNARKAAIWKRALDKALERFARKFPATEYEDITNLRDRGLAKIADQVVEAAAKGDATCWQEIANRMDGKAKEHVLVDMNRVAGEISDDELLNIARGSGDRTADEAERAEDPAGLH